MNLAFVVRLALRYAVGLGLAAAFAAVWVTVQRSGFDLTWLVVVPALLVLYVIGEWTFEPIFSAEAGRAISGRRFSALRIAIALLLALPYFAVFVAVGWLFQNGTPL